METKGKGVLLCVLSGMLLFAGVVMLSSCGGGKSSQSGPTLEGAKQAAWQCSGSSPHALSGNNKGKYAEYDSYDGFNGR